MSQLSDEQVWWRPWEGAQGEMNSIANLMLHLSGNVRQWIISGVGETPGAVKGSHIISRSGDPGGPHQFA